MKVTKYFDSLHFLFKFIQATVLRLVYMTKNSMNTKANYAFRIENHNEIFDPDTKKNINLKGCINSEKKNSFNI